MTWKDTSKAVFTWNQCVTIVLDGEVKMDSVKVRDTHEFDCYEVDDMFGYNKVTRVDLVSE